MRKLASIQRIIRLDPIEGADKIEVATILGWHAVVKKGEFKAGDLCVYCEIDSLLPIREEFAFLQKNGVKRMLVDGKEVEGYRIKTIRLKGQISQGLAFPLSLLGDEIPFGTVAVEDADVTELLGIYKYEIPLPAQLRGKVRGNFPGFIPKTDETRIQNIPFVLHKYKNETYYVTEKLDGSSITIYFKDGDFGVCSRSMNLIQEENNSFWKATLDLKLEDIMRGLNRNLAFQGELVGEGIQKNPLKIKGQKIFLYNIFDINEYRYLNFDEFEETTKFLRIPTVPIIEKNLNINGRDVDELVEMTRIKSEINPDAWIEGLVFRPTKEIRDEKIGRLSFKVINPEYLLNEE